MHRISNPPILYFGTPVALISTVNPDKTFNLAPISSIFWLGWNCIIGISRLAKTAENLLETGECVINLPSVHEVDLVDRLALLTGSNPVPLKKIERGYRYEPDKFGVSGFIPVPSHLVAPPRARQCPVQMEATLVKVNPVAEADPVQQGRILSIELSIRRVHLDERILMDGHTDRVDPDKWRPLIMSFQHFYGIGQRIHASRLASIPEAMYR